MPPNAIILMEKEETKLPVVSYSKVTTYKDCPKKYKFAYIDKLPRVDKHYTIFGSFCHEVLEKFHKHYLEEKETLPFVDVMQQSFKQARENWKEKITKDQLTEAYAIMLKYLMLVTEQSKEEAPDILSVEKKIWIPIEDEFIFYGFIDRVQRDKDGMLHVGDYKTTKDPKYLKDRTQLLLYGYALLVEDDKLKTLRSSYILLKHDLKPMIAEHDVSELIEAKDKFVESWRKIKNDKLFRPTPIFWKCNMCDYVNHCKEGQKLIFSNKKTYGKISW